jgi:hypothetical protein
MEGIDQKKERNKLAKEKIVNKGMDSKTLKGKIRFHKEAKIMTSLK